MCALPTETRWHDCSRNGNRSIRDARMTDANVTSSAAPQPNIDASLSSMLTFGIISANHLFRAHDNTNIQASDMEIFNLTYQEPNNDHSTVLPYHPHPLASPPLINSADHLVAILDHALDIISDLPSNHEDEDTHDHFVLPLGRQ